MVRKQGVRGRPRSFNAHDALLGAMQRFWENGFIRTSVDDIEKHTGISRSSMYNSFGSKEDLFAHALRIYQELIAERLLGPLLKGDRGLSDLHAFIERAVNQLTGPAGKFGCLMTNSMMEMAGGDPDVVRQAEKYTTRFVRTVTAALERASRRGELRVAGVGAKAKLLLLELLGMNVIARAGGSAKEIKALGDAIHTQLESWRKKHPR